jgi:FtsH-binding integral membrane protein
MMPHVLIQTQTRTERWALRLDSSPSSPVAAAVVYLTSINLAAWGQWLLGALLIGIVVSFATLIFHVPISSLAISLFLGVVFVGLTFFDFWRVKAATRGQ